MMSRIGGFIGGGNWKHAHGTAHYGRNFSIKWLKVVSLSYFFNYFSKDLASISKI